MTTVERLRALLDAGTPGPWKTQHTIDRDPEEYSAECVRLTYEHADSIGEPRKTQLHMVYSGDWDNVAGLVIDAIRHREGTMYVVTVTITLREQAQGRLGL